MIRIPILFLTFSLLLSPALINAAEIIDKGRVGDKFIFVINDVTVTLAPGDTINDCLVTEEGLNCNDNSKSEVVRREDVLGDLLEMQISKENCEGQLNEVERQCQERYIENIKDFTSALKNKNYELVEKEKEIEGLKADIVVDQKLLSICQSRVASLDPSYAKVVEPKETAAAAGKAPIILTAKQPLAKKQQTVQVQRASKEKTASFIVSRRNWANIRQGADINSDIVSQALKGDRFALLQSSKGWYKIKLDNGESGWLSREISRKSKKPDSLLTNAETVVVSRTSTHIRVGPGTQYESSGVGLRGEKYAAVSRTANWIQIKLKNTTGWVHKSMVKEALK